MTCWLKRIDPSRPLTVTPDLTEVRCIYCEGHHDSGAPLTGIDLAERATDVQGPRQVVFESIRFRNDRRNSRADIPQGFSSVVSAGIEIHQHVYVAQRWRHNR